MTFNYNELYGQYKNAIKVQESVIKKNRERLKSARDIHNFKEIKRLNGLLAVLYQEKSELEERARGLKEYIE